MTIHSMSLTNPGAESGNTTGWTVITGSSFSAVAAGGSMATPHSGSWIFKAGTSAQNKWYQEVDVSAYATAIDTGDGGASFQGYHGGFTGDADNGALFIQSLDGSHNLLDETFSSYVNADATWLLASLFIGVPAGTRYLRIGTDNIRAAGSNNDNYWDDFTLDFSDDVFTDYGLTGNPRSYQLGAYALANFESEGVNSSQLGALSVEATLISSGLFDVYSHQLGAYALCRGRLDPRKLRAWTFPQDDHIFYVLQLGDETLVFDSWTGQWAQWKSPGFNFWRGADGLAWQGFNVCCDTESGIIWKIDDEGRKDNGDTPIESKVIGGLSERFRTFVPCFMAELAVSEGAPPSGIDASTLSITLRTSSDAGNTWTNHGSIPGEAIGDDITVRWYGLGLMKAPGQLFEIVDTGYARRIDGLDIKVSDDGSPQ